MKRTITLLLILLISFFNNEIHAQCDNDIRNVYFPIDSLIIQKKVYCYKVSYNGEQKSEFFQIFWVDTTKNDIILNQEIVNGDYKPIELWQIKINSQSASLLSHIQYSSEKYNFPELNSKIIKSQIFDWCDFETKKYTLKIKNDLRKLKRTRYSIKQVDSVYFDNNNYLCFEFQDKTIVKQSYTRKTTKKKKLRRYSYFIEGKGMYRTILEYSDLKVEYQLEKIIDFEKWITAGNNVYTK